MGVANGAHPGSARVAGRVVLIEPLGSDTLGLVRLGAGADAGEMTGRFPPEAPLKVGEPIDVTLALDKFHLFDPETGAAIRGATW
jgi:multiple sugar transport system ATP-binding protein